MKDTPAYLNLMGIAGDFMPSVQACQVLASGEGPDQLQRRKNFPYRLHRFSRAVQHMRLL